MFDFQPTLSDGVISVRPTVEADFRLLYAVASDPLIWAVHTARDRYVETVFREVFDAGMASRGMLTVFASDSGEIIGSSRYHGFDSALNQIDIGYTFLSRRCWGGFYNHALKRLMLRHAFRFVDCATFRVGEDNWRSRRAMDKIGGVLTARVDERMMAGIVVRHVVYEIRKESFAASALNCTRPKICGCACHDPSGTLA
jgi:RimJ/RimL family protein N-acetyltransferase